MSNSSVPLQRILAIDPTSRGLGFAVVEEPDSLIDWGVKTVKGDKNSQSLKRAEELLKYYEPDAIVLERTTGKGSRRCLRVKMLLQDIVVLAAARNIKSRVFSRLEVRTAFSQYGVSTKHQIATAISQHFPELSPHLPRIRKAWMSEDERMSIFDATALAVALFKVQLRVHTNTP